MKSIVLAVADGKGQQVIDSIDALTYHPTAHPYGTPRLTYERAGVTINILIVRPRGQRWQNVTLPWTSAGDSGDWDVYLLVADPGSINNEAVADDADGQWIRRAYRKLRQAADAHPTFLRGPWTLEQLYRWSPAKAAELLEDEEGHWTFPLLAGTTHEGALAWEYNPTQQEIDEDTDWEAMT